MGVQQSTSRISLTGGSSMLSGGQVDDNAGQQLSPPGSWGAAPAPGDLSLVQHQPPSFGSGDAISEEIVTDAGAALGHDFLPPGGRGPDGRFRQASTEDSGQPQWKLTPSSGG